MGWLSCFSKSLSDSCNFEDLRTPAGDFSQASRRTATKDLHNQGSSERSKSKCRQPQDETPGTIAAGTCSPPADLVIPGTTHEFSGFSLVHATTHATTPEMPGKPEACESTVQEDNNRNANGVMEPSCKLGSTCELGRAQEDPPEETAVQLQSDVMAIEDQPVLLMSTVLDSTQEPSNNLTNSPTSTLLPHHNAPSNSHTRSSSVPGFENSIINGKETPRTKPSWRPSSNRPHLNPSTPPASARSDRSQNGGHRRHSPRKPALPTLQAVTYPESNSTVSSPWDNISNLPQTFKENIKLLNRALHAIFLEYCHAGAKSDTKLLDGFRFRKLCRECLALTLQDHNNSMDIIFYKFKDPHTSKMSFWQFRQSLPHLAALLELTVAEAKQAIVGSHSSCTSLLAIQCESEGGSSFGGDEHDNVGVLHPSRAGNTSNQQALVDNTSRDSSGPFFVASENAASHSHTQSGSSSVGLPQVTSGPSIAPTVGATASAHSHKVPTLPLTRKSAGISETGQAQPENAACVPQKSPGRISARLGAPVLNKGYKTAQETSGRKGDQKACKHVRKDSLYEYSALDAS